MDSRGKFLRYYCSPEKLMKESVFAMSIEAYVEEVGMEVEGHLG